MVPAEGSTRTFGDAQVWRARAWLVGRDLGADCCECWASRVIPRNGIVVSRQRRDDPRVIGAAKPTGRSLESRGWGETRGRGCWNP